MPNIDFRSRAREHVGNAKDHLSKTGESATRAACLELRMAIESLTYQTLQAYLAEVPNSVMEQWQPKKVIDELLDVDPYADQTKKVFFGKEKTPGVPAETMKFLGEDKRFTVKWGSKAHNALGSFLHEPTISQHDKGSDQIEVSARKKAQDVLSELEEILSTTLYNVNFGVFVEFDCTCGFTIKRKERALKEGKPFVCASCGREYLYELVGENYGFRPDKAVYTCECCKSEQDIDSHVLKGLPLIACSKCGSKAQVEMQYHLTIVERAAPALVCNGDSHAPETTSS